MRLPSSEAFLGDGAGCKLVNKYKPAVSDEEISYRAKKCRSTSFGLLEIA